MKKLFLFTVLFFVFCLVGFGQRKTSGNPPAIGIGKAIDFWTEATGVETYRVGKNGDTTWLNRWANAKDAHRDTMVITRYDIYIADNAGPVCYVIDNKLTVIDSLRAINTLLKIFKQSKK